MILSLACTATWDCTRSERENSLVDRDQGPARTFRILYISENMQANISSHVERFNNTHFVNRASLVTLAGKYSAAATDLQLSRELRAWQDTY